MFYIKINYFVYKMHCQSWLKIFDAEAASVGDSAAGGAAFEQMASVTHGGSDHAGTRIADASPNNNHTHHVHKFSFISIFLFVFLIFYIIVLINLALKYGNNFKFASTFRQII